MVAKEHKVEWTVEFSPSVFIYLEKLAEEQSSTVSDVIDKIVREKAIAEVQTKPEHIIPSSVPSILTYYRSRSPYRGCDELKDSDNIFDVGTWNNTQN